MYKFLYVWIVWLVLILLSSFVQTGGKIHSGMLLIYDAIDTSLWEIDPVSLEANLWLDFDARILSINPVSYRVDRQSIIYFRVPPIGQLGTSLIEIIERDIQSGVEISIMQVNWTAAFIPTSDARLVERTDGSYCVFSYLTSLCSPASQELFDFLVDDSIIWQNDAGYVLKEDGLYRFYDETLTWELLVEKKWARAFTAAYQPQRNALLIAGYHESPTIAPDTNQLMRLDLSSFELEILPIELQNRLSPFDTMLISPDGRYLQYDTNEVVVIDLETGDLVYRPFWYSDRAVWLDDSQRLLFTYYEQPGSSGNRISQVNISTGHIDVVYEGTSGYVWLFQVP